MQPRTVKTLGALLASLTAGALFLMIVDVTPIVWAPTTLAALPQAEDSEANIVANTAVPIQDLRWRGIVIHTTEEPASAVQACHFVIEPRPAGEGRPGMSPVCLRGTENWRQQRNTRHVAVNGWSESIGVCVAGDFMRKAPTERQKAMLVALVRDLQTRFQIPRNRVILNRDLNPTSSSPGDQFPRDEFYDSLLTSR